MTTRISQSGIGLLAQPSGPVQVNQSAIGILLQFIPPNSLPAISQSGIGMLVRRFPIVRVLGVGPPWPIPKANHPTMPVLY